MNKLFLLTFFLLVTIFKLSAQDSQSYVKFTPEQIEIAKKTANEKVKFDTSFNQGFEYQNKVFWFITTNDDKRYYFNSSKTFTEIVYTEAHYDSLMEYIIEESDF